ncbi:MAG: histidine kinase dimerization/phospho-acceptor domain-containing protein, partial [Fidelibacterota bacterium]
MSLHWSNVRTRLTVWYVLALAGILIVYIASFMSLVFFSFRNNLDHNLEQDYEIVEEYISVDPAGTIQIESEHDPYFYERWFDLWSPDGKLLYASRPFSEQGIPPLNSGAATSAGFRFHSLKLPTGARVRIMSGKININGHWLTIRLIQSEDRLWHELKGFLKLLILILPVVLFIAGMGGYLLAKKFLDPIDQMAGKARQIGSRNLEERLPVLNPEDELGHLSQTINALLERLQESFERLKQFTSDAAHELRTPLTAIRSIGEVGLQSRKTQEEYQEMIGSILEENRRLTHLVDNLLFLSRIDAETFNVDPESIDSLELMNQTVDLIQPLAEEKGQKIR